MSRFIWWPLLAALFLVLSGCGIFADLDSIDRGDGDVGIDSDADEGDVSGLPVVQTVDVEVHSSQEVVFSGELTDLGDPEASDHGFCVTAASSEVSAPESESCLALGEPEGLGKFEATWVDLVPGVVYEVRAFAENEERAYGDALEFMMPWEHISLGSEHGCGIAEDRTLWCWGENDLRQLGLGSDDDYDFSKRHVLPQQVGEGHWDYVSAGWVHSCAIDDEGGLWCWGTNFYGALGMGEEVDEGASVSTPRRVGGEDSKWSTVAASAAYTCAIDDEGGLWCWGDNRFEALGLGEEADNQYDTPQPVGTGWEQVSTGFVHTCAIDTDKDLYCWGTNSFLFTVIGHLGVDELVAYEPMQVLPEEELNWTTITTGASHTCAVDEEAILRCWGSNQNGQLGIGSDEERTQFPEEIDAESSWSWGDVSAVGDHTCALREDNGSIYCWGAGTRGRLGNGETDMQRTPTLIEVDQTWSQVSAGGASTCALTDEGTLKCWGFVVPNKARPVPVDLDMEELDFNDVAAGSEHGCAVSSDTAYCWGAHEGLYLGIGEEVEIPFVDTPQRLDGHQGQAVSASAYSLSQADGTGSGHTCLIETTGSLWCWGDGGDGQLGLGDDEDRSFPEEVTDGDSDLVGGVVMTAGRNHSCAIDSAGGLWCWGSNEHGQLGANTSAEMATEPQPFADDGASFNDVAAGRYHTCAVSQGDHALLCWGSDPRETGHLGLGNDVLGEEDVEPQEVETAADVEWRYVSAHENHTCAVGRDGSLWCWGQGSNGRLGVGDQINRSTPEEVVVAGVSWAQIAVGGGHSCAIDSEDNLWCWGANDQGQLGLGDNDDRLSPELVDDGRKWKAVAPGDFHTHAIDEDGNLWSWGYNGEGQLGDGDAWLLEPIAFPQQEDLY